MKGDGKGLAGRQAGVGSGGGPEEDDQQSPLWC